MTKRLASTKNRAPDKAVRMTEPRWRALAAILYSALSITEDPTHRTIIKNLYDDIASQVNVDINPIEVKDDDG